MASPTESKVDENEVASEPHLHRSRDGRGQGGDDQELDMGYPLARQSSIYSLTLDEIQNTVCEPGKTFGSMNMDEFLNNIWSVEEGFTAANNNVSADSTAAAVAAQANVPNGTTGGGGSSGGGGSGSAASGGPPLHRQGSLTLPPPLCRKTVDEVWAEIHGEQGVHHDVRGRAHRGGGNARNAGNADRQQTFGEMTLEDFLIKAGVVREGFGPASPHPPVTVAAESMQQSYGMPMSYPMGTGAEGPGFGHVMGPTVYEYHPPPPHHYEHHPAMSEGHGKRYGNGYGMQQVRLDSPVSPVSSDGIGSGHVDYSGYHGNGGGAGIEVNGAVKMNGRKRGADGGAEKVVERRQRRMIKNRESAARSRARKQAYTVELEAELNLLKEENACLKEEERRAKARRKQTILECMAEHSRANMEKAERSLRRCNSGPL